MIVGEILVYTLLWLVGATATLTFLGDSGPSSNPGGVLTIILWPLFLVALPGYLLMRALLWAIKDGHP